MHLRSWLFIFALLAAAHARTPTFTKPLRTFQRIKSEYGSWEPNLAIGSHGQLMLTATQITLDSYYPQYQTEQIFQSYSHDNGKTWSEPEPTCLCRAGEAQADSMMAFDDAGHIYTTFMDGWSIVAATSRRLGGTFSKPVLASTKGEDADKNWHVVSPDGKVWALTYNLEGVAMATRSTDGGKSWSEAINVGDQCDAYMYGNGGVWIPNQDIDKRHDNNAATVVFIQGGDIEDESDWPEGDIDINHVNGKYQRNRRLGRRSRRRLRRNHRGAIPHMRASATTRTKRNGADDGSNQQCPELGAVIVASISHDGGQTWSSKVLDTLTNANQPCPLGPEYDCEHEYLATMAAIAADSSGNLYVTYNGNRDDQMPGRYWMMTSTDLGNTWSKPADISDALDHSSVYHFMPLVAAGVAKEVGVSWMDNRTGSWNIYYRASDDGGKTFSRSQRLSSETDNLPALGQVPEISSEGIVPWQRVAWVGGFQFPYGDYGGIVMDRWGCVHITWGEGRGHYTGGGTYYSKQVPPPGWGQCRLATPAMPEDEAVKEEDNAHAHDRGNDIGAHGTPASMIAVLTVCVTLFVGASVFGVVTVRREQYQRTRAMYLVEETHGVGDGGATNPTNQL